MQKRRCKNTFDDKKYFLEVSVAQNIIKQGNRETITK